MSEFSQRFLDSIVIELRLTVCASQPLSIASGECTDLHDMVIATDASGLPYLPSTGLRGAVRSRYQQACLMNEQLPNADLLFGFSTGDAGQPSRLRLTSGQIHDSRDIPVDGFLHSDGSEANNNRFSGNDLRDPLLQRFAQLSKDETLTNDHVRLNSRHVVHTTGKFDRSYVPRGSRFTFGMTLWSSKDQIDQDRVALNMICGFFSKGLKIGGASRSGYGELRGVKNGLYWEEFELSSEERRNLWLQSAKELRRLDLRPDTMVSRNWRKPKSNYANTIEARLEIIANDGWLFADEAQGEKCDQGPAREAEVYLDTDSVFRLKEAAAGQLRFPVSALKGALRHRSAFHARRLAQEYCDPSANDKQIATAEEPEIVSFLFGGAKGQNSKGSVGRIEFGQPQIQGTHVMQKRVHTSIDRFTGGVRSGFLFSEEFPSGGSIRLSISIQASREDAKPLLMALDDLQNGLLPLGSDTTNGLGWFEGTVTYLEAKGADKNV